ncbi:MAG: flagellar export chaperone FliS [Anaerotruncus sp.]|nr:flagellar export chaperone FliS [Anaerotruncus sp.]
MAVNPYQKYQQQSVMTMTKGEMLIKLYDETIKQMSAAVLFIGEKDYAGTNRALQKSQQILRYLKATLDFKYKVSADLNSLYDYFIEQTIQANMKKQASQLEVIIPMVEELRDAFIQADRNARSQ